MYVCMYACMYISIHLWGQVEAEAREMSSEAFKKYMSDVSIRIFEVVNSSKIHEKMGGIQVIGLCVHIYMCVYVCVCVICYAYLCAYVFVAVCTCVSLCMWMCVYVYVYVCMCMCMDLKSMDIYIKALHYCYQRPTYVCNPLSPPFRCALWFGFIGWD